MKRTLFLLLLFPILGCAELGYVEPWGKDADLKISAPATPATKLSPMGFLAEKAILFHQKILSPVDGPRSHFRPSSSQYMLTAIRKHGFFKGYVMGCDRLLREDSDPWIYRTIQTEGALFKWDPVPD